MIVALPQTVKIKYILSKNIKFSFTHDRLLSLYLKTKISSEQSLNHTSSSCPFRRAMYKTAQGSDFDMTSLLRRFRHSSRSSTFEIHSTVGCAAPVGP